MPQTLKFVNIFRTCCYSKSYDCYCFDTQWIGDKCLGSTDILSRYKAYADENVCKKNSAEMGGPSQYVLLVMQHSTTTSDALYESVQRLKVRRKAEDEDGSRHLW